MSDDPPQTEQESPAPVSERPPRTDSTADDTEVSSRPSPAEVGETPSRPGPGRLPVVVTVILVLLAALGAFTQGGHLLQIYTFDGPWHLACGRLIVETGSVPRADPFCFPNEGVDWVNLNWLAQVFIYRLYRFAGPPGAVIATLAATLALLLGTIAHLRRRNISPPLALVAFVLATWPSYVTMSLRPRSWSFAFIAILLALLYSADRPGRSLGARRGLVVLGLMTLWNQVHGGFAYGYAILGLDLLGSALDHRRTEGRFVNRRSIELGIIILAGLGALIALHPHGFAAFEHAARYQERVAAYRGLVFELKPPDFGPLIARPTELCLLALLGMTAFGRRLDFRSVLLILVFGHFQLQYARFTFLTPLIFVPIVATELDCMLAEAASSRPRLAAFRERTNALFGQAWRVLPLLLVPAFLTAMLVSPSLPPRDRFHTGPGNRPAGVLEAVTALPRSSRIFNHWNLGGLLDWTLGPTGRIYIDGRGDLHDRGRGFRDYMAITRCEQGWRQKLADDKIDYIAYMTFTDLSRTLVYVEKWEIVYADRHYCLLKRPADWTPTTYLKSVEGLDAKRGEEPGEKTGKEPGDAKSGSVKSPASSPKPGDSKPGETRPDKAGEPTGTSEKQAGGASSGKDDVDQE